MSNEIINSEMCNILMSRVIIIFSDLKGTCIHRLNMK